MGAQEFSSFLDGQDRSTCVLFGDAAGAVVQGQSPDPARGIPGCNRGAEGAETDVLGIPGGGSLHPPSLHAVEHRQHFITMKGRKVFKSAVRVMAGAAREILEQHRLAADEIACVIPHQANRRIIETLADELAIPLERFVIHLDRYGNTSAASIPLALDEGRRGGRLRTGGICLLRAFGAGLTYGSALIRW